MDKIFKLSAPIKNNYSYIKVSDFYSKERGGYEAIISPIQIIDSEYGCVLYGQPIGGVKIDFKMLIPCSRRSKKREEQTINIISENAEKYTREYLDSIGGNEITFELYE